MTGAEYCSGRDIDYKPIECRNNRAPSSTSSRLNRHRVELQSHGVACRSQLTLSARALSPTSFAQRSISVTPSLPTFVANLLHLSTDAVTAERYDQAGRAPGSHCIALYCDTFQYPSPSLSMRPTAVRQHVSAFHLVVVVWALSLIGDSIDLHRFGSSLKFAHLSTMASECVAKQFPSALVDHD